MNIHQLMHILAKRKHPDYPWDTFSISTGHWCLSIQTHGFDALKSHLKRNETQCMVCDQLIDPNTNENCTKHAMQHLKEHNLLPLL
jgi:hypothetical protein